MKEILGLNEISYSYPGHIRALEGISLHVNEGEMFSVIGQNGSGKSTLLNIINALIFPDKGEMYLDGMPVNQKTMADNEFRKQFRRRMGYIFQNADLQLFCPTVMDELMFGPLQIGIPYAEASLRTGEIIDYIGIRSLIDRPVIMLSGGEKKKVAIAAVLTMNPDILLIDEPMAGLDPRTQTFFIELLINLNKAGKTIIFTTHHLDLVDHLQPTTLVLSDEHKILKIAPASEILEDEEFLFKSNLIHEHLHKHGDEIHKHYHSHYVFHKH